MGQAVYQCFINLSDPQNHMKCVGTIIHTFIEEDVRAYRYYFALLPN